jgi:hypoxanthine phosphoribosyltransferase
MGTTCTPHNIVVLNSSYTVPLKSPVLIVDEIADRGITLGIMAEHFKNLAVEYKTLTLLYKNRSKVHPDYFIREVPDKDWIIFPWEC